MFSLRLSVAVSAAIIALAASCTKKSADQSAAKSPSAARAQPVEVVSLERRELRETITVVGTLAANEYAQIKSEIAGQVRQIFFEEGQAVTAGQVLIKIDDSELIAQYNSAEAKSRLATLNLDRIQNLGKAQLVSASELDTTKSAQLASAAELALIKVRLDKTEIKAPFAGLIGSRSVSPGDYVNTQNVLTSINDLSRLKIDFQVPERFMAQAKVGSRFNILINASADNATPDSASEAVSGELYFVSPVIDRTTRSLAVKGLIAQAPAGLRPGMFTLVELVLAVKPDALSVPESAILNTTEGTRIIAAKTTPEGPVAEFVPVELGLRAHGLVEIKPKKELAEGTPIVASGVGALILFPGGKLELRPLKSALTAAPAK